MQYQGQIKCWLCINKTLPMRAFVNNLSNMFSVWLKRMRNMIERYFIHMSYWLNVFDHPVHVLVYEELKKNTLWELYKVSKFLDYPITFETLWCIKHKSDKQTLFLRQKPKWLRPEHLFTYSSKEKLNGYLRKLRDGSGQVHGLYNNLDSYIV